MSRRELAIEYAKLGWKVFPVHTIVSGQCSCGNRECENPGKHPATTRGFKDAVNITESIETLWRANPEANIGIATGEASGIFAIDIDMKASDGFLAINKLQLDNDDLPDTLICRTGSGGEHRYFKYPIGRRIRSRTNWMPGVDIRGDGGYVVAPDSAHRSGKNYEWSNWDTAISDCPEWLLKLLEEPNSLQGEQSQANKEAGVILEGTRNTTFTSIAGSLQRHNLGESIIHNQLMLLNQQACNPPLKEIEIKSIVKSVSKYSAAHESFSCTWPQPLSNDAYHGILGEIVQYIKPRTESDPAAVLVQLIVGLGSGLGHNPRLAHDGSYHHSNMFTLIVGDSSTGRKGTALSIARQIIRLADPEWFKLCNASGLSTGEGLIHRVRDPIEKENDEGKLEVIDEGVLDKRLLLVESEFGSVLSRSQGQTSSLSEIMRQAFDSPPFLSTLTKVASEVATDPHISVIGHITPEELAAKLNQTELHNGFINRFVVILVERSQLLPLGGKLDNQVIAQFGDRLRDIVEHSKGTHEMRRTPEADDLWVEKYPELVAKKEGLLNVTTARSLAHITRIAMIYALLDKSSFIGVPHLKAALEIWRYSEDSCRYLFTSLSKDPIAEKVLSALNARSPDGMTTEDIHNLLGRNSPAEKIHKAIAKLKKSGLVREERDSSQPGRPKTVFFKIDEKNEKTFFRKSKIVSSFSSWGRGWFQ